MGTLVSGYFVLKQGIYYGKSKIRTILLTIFIFHYFSWHWLQGIQIQ